MIVFRTEFPMNTNLTPKKLFRICYDWLYHSPHSQLQKELEKIDFDNLVSDTTLVSQSQEEKLEFQVYEDSQEQIQGVKYFILSNKQDWTTYIIHHKSAAQQHVSIEINCENRARIRSIPRVNIPRILSDFVNYYGADGKFHIQPTPYNLEDREIDFASSFLKGQMNNTLPIVYISSKYDGRYVINPSVLSKKLMGLAHVIVEPNYQFGIRLAIDMAYRNPMKGAIGIYWPNGAGYEIIHRQEDHDECIDKIVYNIIDGLKFSGLMNELRWTYLEQCKVRNQIETLKSARNSSLDSFIEAFDKENANLKKQLAHSEGKIESLQGQVTSLRSKVAECGTLLNAGKEEELIEDEIKDFLIELLQKASNDSNRSGRSYHICEALLEANSSSGKRQAVREKLREILTDWKWSDKKRNELSSLGFDVKEDGKHIKAVFRGDDRYTLTISKTPSDHRSNLNNFSDACKILF